MRKLKVNTNLTDRELKARDPQGYAEEHGHSWPPFPSARPLAFCTCEFTVAKCRFCRAMASLKAGTCVRWGSGPDRCLEALDHRGPCRDASGATTLTLAAEILGAGK